MIDVATTGPCHSRIAGIGEAGRLAGLRRADDDHRLARLGRDEVAVDAAEGEPAGLAARGHEAGGGPAGAPSARRSAPTVPLAPRCRMSSTSVATDDRDEQRRRAWRRRRQGPGSALASGAGHACAGIAGVVREASEHRVPSPRAASCGHDAAEESSRELAGEPRAARRRQARQPTAQSATVSSGCCVRSAPTPGSAARLRSARHAARPDGHARVRVDELALERGEPVLDEERALRRPSRAPSRGAGGAAARPRCR